MGIFLQFYNWTFTFPMPPTLEGCPPGIEAPGGKNPTPRFLLSAANGGGAFIRLVMGLIGGFGSPTRYQLI